MASKSIFYIDRLVNDIMHISDTKYRCWYSSSGMSVLFQKPTYLAEIIIVPCA